jgi:hypothetical protein
MRRRVVAALLSSLAIVLPASAQPRGGVLKVTLTNGTTGARGRAEKVTLYRLRNEMIPAKELPAVEGSFEMRDIEVEGERPMLLQVTYSGVTYNQPVNFGRGYEASVDVTVYDVVSRWNDEDLRVTTARTLYRRDGDKLLVDEVYVVQNVTNPPKTYHDPAGTFRFHLPTANLRELRSISARGESGMPVPQQASPAPDSEDRSVYVTKTAFKPGETELVVSYEVSYGAEGYELRSRAFYPLQEVYAFVAPPDVRIESGDWENLGLEPEGRFTALRKRDVPRGAPLAFKLSGGSEHVASEETSEAEASSSGETVTLLPDAWRFEMAVLIVLMAAALAYGLLATLYPPAGGRASRNPP